MSARTSGGSSGTPSVAPRLHLCSIRRGVALAIRLEDWWALRAKALQRVQVRGRRRVLASLPGGVSLWNALKEANKAGRGAAAIRRAYQEATHVVGRELHVGGGGPMDATSPCLCIRCWGPCADSARGAPGVWRRPRPRTSTHAGPHRPLRTNSTCPYGLCLLRLSWQAVESLRLDLLGWVALLIQSLSISYMASVLPLLTVRSPFLFYNKTHAAALLGAGGGSVCLPACTMFGGDAWRIDRLPLNMDQLPACLVWYIWTNSLPRTCSCSVHGDPVYSDANASPRLRGRVPAAAGASGRPAQGRQGGRGPPGGRLLPVHAGTAAAPAAGPGAVGPCPGAAAGAHPPLDSPCGAKQVRGDPSGPCLCAWGVLIGSASIPCQDVRGDCPAAGRLLLPGHGAGRIPTDMVSGVLVLLPQEIMSARWKRHSSSSCQADDDRVLEDPRRQPRLHAASAVAAHLLAAVPKARIASVAGLASACIPRIWADPAVPHRRECMALALGEIEYPPGAAIPMAPLPDSPVPAMDHRLSPKSANAEPQAPPPAPAAVPPDLMDGTKHP